jgi:hypothetical protein
MVGRSRAGQLQQQWMERRLIDWSPTALATTDDGSMEDEQSWLDLPGEQKKKQATRAKTRAAIFL